MSFALTTEQFRNRTKTVTRRKGWKFLKPGDVVMGCVKCQGIKKGTLERLGPIRIVSVGRERLNAVLSDPTYGRIEATLEGFCDMHPIHFVEMFCHHMGGDAWQDVTRIEFEYMEAPDAT
jgi:hypothetical protein